MSMVAVDPPTAGLVGAAAAVKQHNGRDADEARAFAARVFPTEYHITVIVLEAITLYD